jgi:hypothetical protein
MITRLLIPVALSLAVLPGAALAQSKGSSGTPGNPSAAQSTQSLPDQIQQKLKDQGFTQVQVVPGSFIVSAKDKQGDPVTMVIGPNSMTVFTVNAHGGSSTTGSSSNQSGQSAKH